MSEEIYFQDLTYERTHDNKGCVMGEMIFRNAMTYEEFLDIQNERFFVLNDKTQNNWNELKKLIEEKIQNIKMNYSQINGSYFNMDYVIETYEDILKQMQELENRKV